MKDQPSIFTRDYLARRETFDGAATSSVASRRHRLVRGWPSGATWNSSTPAPPCGDDVEQGKANLHLSGSVIVSTADRQGFRILKELKSSSEGNSDNCHKSFRYARLSQSWVP